ncbi:MAG: hypothetical protein ABI579_01435 [Candidatus Sumerlaeota bacterium]
MKARPFQQMMPPRNRLHLFAGGAVFAIVVLFRLCIIKFSPINTFIASLPDDAWYYIGIARHIAAGAGSTFDGIHATNGYHPLWMIVVATSRLVTGDMELLRFAGMIAVLQLLLGAAAACMNAMLCHRILKSNALAGLMLALHATPFLVYGMTDGMESGLLQLFIAAIFWGAYAFRPFTASISIRVLAFGAIASMAVLTRLDFGLFVAALMLVLLSIQRDLRRAAVIAFPCAIMIPLYLFMNRMHFDTVMPISALLKSTFPHWYFNADALREHAIAVSAGLVTIALSAINARRAMDRDVQLLLRSSAAFVALHLIHTIFFTHWGIQKWHFTAYWPLLIWQIVILERTALVTGRAIGFAALLSFAGQFAFFHNRTDRAFQPHSYTAALWARDNIPTSRLIGMSDCGIFGAVRDNFVVNLDGVVNNAAYQQALKQKGLRGYANDLGISYIAHHAVDAEKVRKGYGTYEYKAYAHLGTEDKPSALMLRESDEVYRGVPFDDGTGTKVFVIWKRRRELSPHDFNVGSTAHMP